MFEVIILFLVGLLILFGLMQLYINWLFQQHIKLLNKKIDNVWDCVKDLNKATEQALNELVVVMSKKGKKT